MADYINAGFLLINLKKWREDDVEGRFVEFLSSHKGEYCRQDQGIINLVFENKIKIVPPKYNLIGYFHDYKHNRGRKLHGIETGYYTKDIVEDSRKNPVLLHFIGKDYPLWKDKGHKYADEYMRYANLAGCAEFIQYSNPSIWNSKVLI